MNEFSVLISVYHKENPNFLDESLNSIFNQTVLPSEVVLVKDGPLPRCLDQIISSYQDRYDILKVVVLNVNLGLGRALNEGLKRCTYDLVARMDSDDICVCNRFEKQLEVFLKYPNVSVVGSCVDEFSDSPSVINSIRYVPELHSDIFEYSKRRCPINHPTVMFRKKVIDDCGGYLHFYLFEDYYLWVRLLLNNVEFYNVQQSLVLMRVDPSLFNRRGGFSYAFSEIKLQHEFLRLRHIDIKMFFSNVLIRFFIRIIPNRLRAFIYRNLLRNK